MFRIACTTSRLHRTALSAVWLLACFTAHGTAAEERSTPAAGPSQTYADLVLADEPAVYWRFEDADDAEQVRPQVRGVSDEAALSGTPEGELRLGVVGPRRPDFPPFDAQNRALEIPAGGGFVRILDPGDDSPLDFDSGDSITLEAWINPRQLSGGRYAYIVGKGRTQNPDVASHNQNYAMRLKGTGGAGGLNFLFRSAGAKPDWHRWDTGAAVAIGDGWHHVAVTYTFGRPDSIRGYVDGEPVKGKWDMGGPTEAAPVVDNDDVWIGSGMGGGAGSTFDGGLDEIAIYRRALPAETFKARFEYVRPEPVIDLAALPTDKVRVEVYEGVPNSKSWRFRPPKFLESYETEGFAFVEVPKRYSEKGIQVDRSNPFLLRAMGRFRVPRGPYRILIRCRNAGRLYVDDELVCETDFHSISSSAHGTVFPVDRSLAPHIRPLQRGDTEDVATLDGDGELHVFRFDTIVGGQERRPETGETAVCIGPVDGDFHVLSTLWEVPLTNAGWTEFARQQREEFVLINARRRQEAGRPEAEYWEHRHELARQWMQAHPGPTPPAISNASGINNDVDRFLAQALEAAGEQPAALVDDHAFLKRVSLDVIGRIPTEQEIARFFADDRPDRRAHWIDRLLQDPEWADHWVGYWQDVLAENPNIVNPTLNNTGPFRWWIYESFLDNKPIDRFATELVMMEGSAYFGGPAGFAMATQNDAPMAAKAHIIGQAFLGLEMKCARCHDAPFHEFLQEDLFSLAAMLKRGPESVPKTSTVPAGTLARSSLVQVTLKPGEPVEPEWAFPELASTDELAESVLRNPDDTRERLAALITSPQNERFAQVIVNRLWRRYFGVGIVEPVDDWEGAKPEYPELLEFLARELVAHDYDLKHVAGLLLKSQAYQRVPRDADNVVSSTPRPHRLAAPVRRRMTAEQLVDSLFTAAGKPLDAGPMAIDIDTARSYKSSLHLGEATRGWHFTSMSNERDRPSLALPYAQPFVTLMETFGWRAARQDPLTVRESEPMVLQPAELANGIISRKVTRLSEQGALTELALEKQPVSRLVDRLFLRVLSRPPTDDERAMYMQLLGDGYDARHTGVTEIPAPPELPRNLVAWSNHLDPRANEIKQELQEAVKKGDPPTVRLEADWRERMEDAVWTLINSPEFLFIP